MADRPDGPQRATGRRGARAGRAAHGARTLTGSREARWEGARNLRDLGGLPLVGGGETVPGRLWRGAAPEWLTATGWARARDAGLTTVVDLRNAPERGRTAQHPEVEPAAYVGVRVLHTPTEDHEDDDFLAEWGAWLDHPRSYAPNAARYPARIAAVLTAIADAPGPVLVHCAGGRDRTGLVCALLLTLTGVEPQAVVADYEAGFRGADGYAGPGPALGLAYDPVAGAWVEQVAEPLAAADLDRAVAQRLPVLADWLAGLDVAAYLTSAGVGSDRLARLTRLLRR